MNRLVARDLSVFPPGSSEPVVKGIDLTVDPGGRVAITGPNGSGKSSLILGLAGLWNVSGHLELDGRPLDTHDVAEWRRNVAVILQDPSSQLLQSTVFDEIAFAPRNLGRPEGEIPALVDRWAQVFGLAAELQRDPSTLSAGRQHLVVTAAALAAEPDLLLADEPTAHLDPEGIVRVMEAVENETRRGLAVVWVTQNPSELGGADQVLELQERESAGKGNRSISAEEPDTAGSRPGARDGPLAEVEVAAMKGDEVGPTIRVPRPFGLSIPPSGLLLLTGPNGVGKSALLGAIAGLMDCPQVRVRWSGRPQHAPIIALQYPEQQLFEERVADEVSYAALARGDSRGGAREKAAGLFHRLGLEPEAMLGRRIWELSGGERRLVQIVAALAAPASVYLLDEPTAGLDACRRVRLAGLLSEASVSTPVMVATQDHAWAKSLEVRTLEIPEPVTKWG